MYFVSEKKEGGGDFVIILSFFFILTIFFFFFITKEFSAIYFYIIPSIYFLLLIKTRLLLHLSLLQPNLTVLMSNKFLFIRNICPSRLNKIITPPPLFPILVFLSHSILYYLIFKLPNISLTYIFYVIYLFLLCILNLRLY